MSTGAAGLAGPLAERRHTALIIAAAFGGFAGFFVLLPVIPVVAESLGGPFDAGAVTGALMIGAVATQLMCPTLLRVLGYKGLFLLGLGLLGFPALAYGQVSGTLWLIVIISLIRGVGFGILTVVPPALIARTTDDNRSASLGTYAFAMGVSGTLAPAAGLLLFDHSLHAAALVGGVIPVSAALLLSLRRVSSPAVPRLAWRELRFFEGRGPSSFGRPLFAWLPGSILYGGFFSFLPLWVDDGVPAALAVFGGSFAVGRLIAGRGARRTHPLLLLRIGAATAAIGVAAIFVSGLGPLIAGSALAGGGVGMMSLSALLGVLGTVDPKQYPIATAAWAVSFDAGLAAGGLLLGAVVAIAGYDPAFSVAIGLLLVGVLLTGLRRRGTRLAPPEI